jgi:hypothetical protein
MLGNLHACWDAVSDLSDLHALCMDATVGNLWKSFGVSVFKVFEKMHRFLFNISVPRGSLQSNSAICSCDDIDTTTCQYCKICNASYIHLLMLNIATSSICQGGRGGFEICSSNFN